MLAKRIATTALRQSATTRLSAAAALHRPTRMFSATAGPEVPCGSSVDPSMRRSAARVQAASYSSMNTACPSTAISAEGMDRRRARDQAASEARAAARAGASSMQQSEAAGSHHSDAYTVGWERRLGSFDDDLHSTSSKKAQKHLFPLALKGWTQRMGVVAVASPWGSSPDQTIVTKELLAREEPLYKNVDTAKIWKDVDVAEACWSEFDTGAEADEE